MQVSQVIGMAEQWPLRVLAAEEAAKLGRGRGTMPMMELRRNPSTPRCGGGQRSSGQVAGGCMMKGVSWQRRRQATSGGGRGRERRRWSASRELREDKGVTRSRLAQRVAR